MRCRSIAVSLLIALIFAICLPGAVGADDRPEVTSSPFIDVPGEKDHARAFALLNTLGIFEGYGDGRVGPDNPLTRTQFAKVAVCIVNQQDMVRAAASAHPDFDDGDQIAPTWWGWVNAAAELELVRGYADGTFRPRSNITFAEAVTVLLRAAGYGPVVDGLGYPEGYLRRAHELGITRGVDLDAGLPITRAEMAVMTVNAMSLNPPGTLGEPATDYVTEYRETLLDSRPERTEGVVTRIVGSVIEIDGELYDLAPTLYLFGAADLEAVRGRWVVAYVGGSTQIEYIEVVEGQTRFSGQLRNLDASTFRLRVDDRWIKWVPDGAVRPATEWQLNGRDVNVERVLRLVGGVNPGVTVTARGEWAERVEILLWDGPELIVKGEPESAGGGWTVPVQYIAEGGGIESRNLAFRSEQLPLPAGSQGDVRRVDQLQEGDVLRIASIGGWGLGEGDTVASDRLHRIEVLRSVVSGGVEEVRVFQEEGDLLFIFDLDDGTQVYLRRDRFLGAPGDMTLNDLYHADHITFALGFDGYARRVTEARVSGTRTKYVRILTLTLRDDGQVIRDAYLVVDDGGEAVTYELVHPSLWALFIDDELEVRRGSVVQIRINEQGKCEGVITWVNDKPIPAEYMVVHVDPDEKIVTLRRLSSEYDISQARDLEIDDSILVAVEPAVYSAQGHYHGIEVLEVGQRVHLYRDDRGDIANIEPVAPAE